MRLHRAAPTLLIALWLCAVPHIFAQTPAQTTARTLDKLNLQFHGYATESAIYSNQNNWDTTNSTGGSGPWTEGVANLTARPASRLSLGAQARYFRLGTYGNRVLLDWASAEFKVNEYFGIRGGKVKSPGGLLNEVQDIDPAYLWVLLPQSIYPIASRTGNLAHYGGVVFGAVPLGERFGKLEYRAYGGQRVVPSDDGYFEAARSGGLSVPKGIAGPTFGGNLHWRTPIPGLRVGFAETRETYNGPAAIGPFPGTIRVAQARNFFFARYERRKLMLAAESSRMPFIVNLRVPPIIPAGPGIRADERNFYVMASYRLAAKLNAGAYYSSTLDRQAPFSSNRYQKDWTLATRYDLTSFLYLKLEQHFLDGTTPGYSKSNNPNGLAETSRLSFAKLGVTF